MWPCSSRCAMGNGWAVARSAVSQAWHPQGPIHSQPYPVPLLIICPTVLFLLLGAPLSGGGSPRNVVARGGDVEWGALAGARLYTQNEQQAYIVESCLGDR